MNYDQFIQIGGTTSTLFVLWWMIKYFIKAIEKKDTQIEVLHKDFLTIIGNHVKHEESAFKELTESIKQLARK